MHLFFCLPNRFFVLFYPHTSSFWKMPVFTRDGAISEDRTRFGRTLFVAKSATFPRNRRKSRTCIFCCENRDARQNGKRDKFVLEKKSHQRWTTKRSFSSVGQIRVICHVLFQAWISISWPLSLIYPRPGHSHSHYKCWMFFLSLDESRGLITNQQYVTLSLSSGRTSIAGSGGCYHRFGPRASCPSLLWWGKGFGSGASGDLPLARICAAISEKERMNVLMLRQSE